MKSPTVYLIDPHYHFNFIQNDYDDNKFIDTAICGNADFLITEDKDFDLAKNLTFPKINIIEADKYIEQTKITFLAS